eukprot:13524873-Alexandrium_andersonii.AAC.1
MRHLCVQRALISKPVQRHTVQRCDAAGTGGQRHLFIGRPLRVNTSSGLKPPLVLPPRGATAQDPRKYMSGAMGAGGTFWVSGGR